MKNKTPRSFLVPSPKIELAKLERLFQVFDDVKKGIAYNKHEGTWSWFDRDEQDNGSAYHGGFPTALDAMLDAVEPYMEDSE